MAPGNWSPTRKAFWSNNHGATTADRRPPGKRLGAGTSDDQRWKRSPPIAEMMNLAPIVLFVYNRPDHTRQVLEALKANGLADQSILYIHADGPRQAALEEDLDKIAAVRALIRSEQWCREVRIVESNGNKGLARAVVEGVSDVVERHGRVIVLEDDIVATRGFLSYMNTALQVYADDESVMQISACMYDADIDSQQDTFFLKVMSCHGWGTWRRCWARYDDDVIGHLLHLQSEPQRTFEFDIEGSAHFFEQLRKNVSGELDSWAVRWYASWWRAGGYCLFPRKSLVRNIGFDGSGVNTGSGRSYLGPTVDHIQVVKSPVVEPPEIREKVVEFWKKYLDRPRKQKKPSAAGLLSHATAPILSLVRRLGRALLVRLFPELQPLFSAGDRLAWHGVASGSSTYKRGANVHLAHPHHIHYSSIGDYTYIGHNSFVSYTEIGKFCSIGPNFHCGWGMHPTDGLSTSPSFYSTRPANGVSFCGSNKVPERKKITIGNDVFIGMNVTVLDGVTIGDGAVVGAGCVLSKDVPPYAVVAGNPVRTLRYRFTGAVRDALGRIKWWEFDEDKLREVASYFSDPPGFISRQGGLRED